MKAAIDIGTNTALLLVAEIVNGQISTLYEEQQIPRLGKGVDKDKVLLKESMTRVIESLKSYKNTIITRYPEVDSIIVTATSAVRDASNRNEFLKQVETDTGFKIMLLSGEEEAHWTFQGALSALSNRNSEKSTVVLDIGGGSTEVAAGVNTIIKESFSFDMGSVRFTERFLKTNPPLQTELEDCKKEIISMFKAQNLQIKSESIAIGVAGTLTTLAVLDSLDSTYNSDRVSGYILYKRRIDSWVSTLSKLGINELLELNPNVMKGREDLILAGCLILQGFLEYYDFQEIIVSTGGIRHGAILNNHNF